MMSNFSSVGGLIGDRWRALGAENGPLGNPMSDELVVPGRNGRRRIFNAGEIVWSPDQGPNMVVAGWVKNGARGVDVTIDWGPTTPFNYDLFIVRWDRNGSNVGQETIRGGPRESGRYTLTVQPDGQYSFIVEGCDAVTFGSSRCRQGWTIPVNLNLAFP